MIFTGCNSSPYPLAPVSGTVRVDGQTLSGGSVVFRRIADDKNKNVGKAGYGEIKSDGTFVVPTGVKRLVIKVWGAGGGAFVDGAAAAPGACSGRLIAVEGIDGFGKSTHIYLLQRWLELQRLMVDKFDELRRSWGFTTIAAGQSMDALNRELRGNIERVLG